MNDVESDLLKLLTRAHVAHPDRYMGRIFENKQRVILQAVKFIFKMVEN